MDTLRRHGSTDEATARAVAPEVATGAPHHRAAELGRDNRTPFDDVISARWRWPLLALLTVALWTLYFAWRPPAPMLGLRHTEHLGRDTPTIAMTFDDAPHPVITPLLLAALKRSGARASFFVIGDSLRYYPELTHRIIDEGHAMANHSQTHRNLTRVDSSDFAFEIETCFGVIRDAGGGDGRMFRPPGGGLDRDAMRYLYDRNLELAWWSNNVGDWARPPAWKIATQVNSHLRGGDIILLHDTPGGYGTPQAVSSIVRAAKRQGLTVGPMPEN